MTRHRPAYISKPLFVLEIAFDILIYALVLASVCYLIYAILSPSPLHLPSPIV